MLIYRVELKVSLLDRKKRFPLGPYASYGWVEDDKFYNKHFKYFNHLRAQYFDFDRCPDPEDDGLSFAGNHCYNYGFGSLEDLGEWFHLYFKDMEAAGFYSAVYSCNDVEIGNKQLRFKGENATLLSVKYFDEFFEEFYKREYA